MNLLLIGRCALLLYTLLILGLSLISLSHQALPDFSAWDKLQHGMAYLGFALLCASASRNLKQYIILIILCAAFGVLVEYLQGLTTYRTASLADFIANLIGLFFGMAVRELLKRYIIIIRFEKTS